MTIVADENSAGHSITHDPWCIADAWERRGHFRDQQVIMWGRIITYMAGAKAGAGHPIVEEGGAADTPTEGKGHPKPAASTADIDGASQDGTSSAATGKAEKDAAADAGQAKEQRGRGRRKAEEE